MSREEVNGALDLVKCHKCGEDKHRKVMKSDVYTHEKYGEMFGYTCPNCQT